ncbi:GET complex subunit get1 [Orbilia brochopaga]
MPSKASLDLENMRRHQLEVLRIRKEMSNTSSQDEFAKWAKLRRQHDKKVAELEKLSEIVGAEKLRFSRIVSSSRWLLFSILGIFLQVWYRKEPVLWLPKGWLPGVVEWGLSFPQAPKGSISANIWSASAAVAFGIASHWIKSIRI